MWLMTKHSGDLPILIGPGLSMATMPGFSFSLWEGSSPDRHIGSLWRGADRLIGWVATVGAVEDKENEQIGMVAHLMAGLWLFWRLVWPTFRRPGGNFLLGRIVV